MNKELKECPNPRCMSHNIWRGYKRGQHVCWCGDCFVMGAPKDTREEAGNAWNDLLRRAEETTCLSCDTTMEPCSNPECEETSVNLTYCWDKYYVFCPTCELQGPPSTNIAEALRLWNLLPRTSASADQSPCRTGRQAKEAAKRKGSGS